MSLGAHLRRDATGSAGHVILHVSVAERCA